MTLRNTLVAALAAIGCCAHAAEPALPSAALKLVPEAPSLAVPAADVAFLAEEDSKALGRPLRIGVSTRLDRELIADGAATAGAWSTLPDGRALWTADIHSSGAVWLDLHFSGLELPASAELYLSNADGSYVLGPIRGSDALADGQYYTNLIPGERMRLEVAVAESEQALVNLALASVTYGYRGVLGFGGDHPDAGRSGACNIDVACPLGDDWTDQIQGVGQYIFQSGANSFVCTGTLIANTAGTSTPYFLTANHCVSSNTVANTMRVYWNYQSPICRTPGSPESGNFLPRPATWSNGASLRMNYAPSDNSLVELNAPVPVAENPFFVGWDRRDLATPGNPQVSDAVTIHHPAGHEKRISKDDDALSVTGYPSDTPNPNGTHYRIGQWEHGTTEGGSSGSALFTPEGHLIGTLHGGFASCNSITQDWYGRIHRAWEGGGSPASSLKSWLDPEETAPDSIDGYYGEPLDEADLAITLDATPNPVDIGEQLTLSVDVDNLGPDDATNVSVAIALPTGLAYASGGSAEWTCSASGAAMTCNLVGDLANGTSAETLSVLANVVANETGTVSVSAEVSAANPDPDGDNNTASVDVEITGEPPLPDAIFCDGFEDGGDGSCPKPADPDIVSGDLDATIPDDFGGLSVNWLTGDAIPGEIDGYHFNPYRSNTAGANFLSFWFQLEGADNAGGVSLNGAQYAVLASGDTIGPDSTFIDTPQAVPTALWRLADGVDGYLGFRFTNTVTGQINYGYVRLTTTGTQGFPATLSEYAYNQAGQAITIP